MLLWTDMFLQLALSLSLLWIFRLDVVRGEQAGKQSKFASRARCCYGVFSATTVVPLSYGRVLLVADSIRASPLWFRSDYLLHFALVEVCHALFAVWVVIMVAARVARDDLRARAFAPLSEAALADEDELLADSVQLEVFSQAQAAHLARTSGSRAPSPASSVIEQQQQEEWSDTKL